MFHVQTEDSGVNNPHIFTHMFHGGVILTSRKLEYDREASEGAVKALMQAQHRAVLKELKKGSFADKIDSYLGDNPDLLPREALAYDDADESDDPIAAPEPSAPRAVPESSDISGAFDAITGPLSADDSVGVVHSPAPQSAPAPPGATHDTVHNLAPNASHNDAGTYAKHRRSNPRIKSTPPPIPVSRSPNPAIPPPIPPRLPGSASTQIRGSVAQRGVAVPPPRGSPSQSSQLRGSPSQSSQLRGSPSQSTSVRRPKTNSGGVVVSRPAVIVGAPSKMVGGTPSHHQSSSRTRTRKAREDSASDSLFGQDLISEKSLDEVILAYLSEDSTDD